MRKINRIELHNFGFDVPNRGLGPNKTAGVGNGIYAKGAQLRITRYAVVIEAGDGVRGEYVTHWVGTRAALAETAMLAPRLIGCDSERREEIFADGCVPVPDGPGLGVSYDWDFITANRVDHLVFE